MQLVVAPASYFTGTKMLGIILIEHHGKPSSKNDTRAFRTLEKWIESTSQRNWGFIYKNGGDN